MNNQSRTTSAHESSAQKGGIYILRIATVLLAVVSWWATAQGMANYVFSTQWQAYLASMAIQAILLGLNFYLPTFWRYTTSDVSKWGLGILSFIVLICSSWFSYVYIVEHAYQESWDTSSQLLVQSTYREQLYDAMEYTEEYNDTLRDILGDQITTLYSQAKGIERSDSQSIESLDLTQDRTNYAENQAFAAYREVDIAIQTVENALRIEASASDREASVRQLSELQDQINGQIDILKTDIDRTESAIKTATNDERQAQESLNNAENGTDTASLVNALNTTRQRLSNLQQNVSEQEQDLSDYQTALRLLQQYAGYLNITSIGTGIQVSSSLRNIQSDLLSGEVDVSSIEEEARRIFEQLQASEDTLNTDDIAYQTMMNEMDSFIRNVQKYAEIKESEQVLTGLTDELQNDTSATNSDWKTSWTKKLENLKSVIGGLPSYTGSYSQTLRRYERTNSMNKLDNALRKYISNHNAADQALIYLFNPHRALAWFSFVLAFFLDISAFITGFIIDIVDRRKPKRIFRSDSYTEVSDTEQSIPIGIVQNDFVSVPSTARRYAYLTGDFTKEGEKYYYRALEGSDQIEIEMLEEKLDPGFHVEINGQFCAIAPQDLALFRMPDGPLDGVYQDCYLQYSDHTLSIKKASEDEYHYLATTDEDVPVYQIRKNECICQDVQDIPLRLLTFVILALNSRGTQIAAIYIV